MSAIQLKGNLTLGPTGTPMDVQNFVSEFRLTTTRASVTIPATLGLDESTAAAQRSDTLTITFHSAVDAASMWAMLYTQIGTADAEVDFAGNFEDGATAPDNLEFSGTVILLSLDSGGTVGQLRQQTLTLPVKAGTLATASA